MELELIYRIIRVNTLIGLLASVAIGIFYGMFEGAGVLAGALWGSVNLALIKSLVISTLNIEGVGAVKILVSLLIKFPVVYFAGYILLITFSYVSLLAGFSLLFVVMFALVLKTLLQQKNPQARNPKPYDT